MDQQRTNLPYKYKINMADDDTTRVENDSANERDSHDEGEFDAPDMDETDEEIELENDAPVLCRAHEQEVCVTCGIDFREINADLKRRRI